MTPKPEAAGRPRVLIVAFHYPPVGGSSGVQRALKFSAYLRDFGWEPMVLTVNPRAYELTTDGQMAEIPKDIVIERAFALDAGRHLTIFGKYPRAITLPDRWQSWWPAGVLRGLAMIRKYRPAVMLSTFPIATAHMVAKTLNRLTGVPWVADFRDNMTDPGFPRDPTTWRFNRRLEAETVKRCSRALFVTPGALRMYQERYPEIPASRWSIVENGYDEENFTAAERGFQPAPRAADAPLRLVHSGILYPEERDPRPFFGALRQLKASGEVSSRTLNVILRATAADHVYTPMLRDYGIDDIVTLAPSVRYQQALQEMLAADGLLLFQAAMCNHQIPAKLYEYLRARRPILALTDPAGDTAQALRDAGSGAICRLDDEADILAALRSFLAGLRDGSVAGANQAMAQRHSRRARTAELAALLSDVAAQARGAR